MRIDDFTLACQQKLSSSAATAAPASLEEGTIVCTKADGSSEPFATVEGQPDIQNSVKALCQSSSTQAQNVMARLFDYWDPLSWQCFQNEHQLGQDVTQGDIDTYFCNITYPDSSAILQGEPPFTAYNWVCQLDKTTTTYRVSMDTVCQKRPGGKSDAIAMLDPKDFTDPNGWQCWGPVKQ